MSTNFPVKGLADIDRYLSVLPKNLQNNAYRAGLTAAAKPIRDEARQQARKRSGKMARAVKTGSPRRNEDGTFSVSISLKGEHAFVGIFQEYGVGSHLITAGDSPLSPRVLNRRIKKEGATEEGGVLKIGDQFVSGAVMHPGHAAHPFMRPALDTKADEAVKAFADRVRGYLEGKTGFAAPVDGEE